MTRVTRERTPVVMTAQVRYLICLFCFASNSERVWVISSLVMALLLIILMIVPYSMGMGLRSGEMRRSLGVIR